MALTQIPLSTLAGTSGTPVSDTNKLIDDDDNRMDDAREPLAHATTHASGGSDPVTPISIGAATSAQGALADSAVQPAGTPASNQLAYWTTAQILAGANLVSCDSTHSRIGIGTLAPLGALHVVGNGLTAHDFPGFVATDDSRSKTLGVQGDTFAYLVGYTPDKSFACGISTVGKAFAGSVTAHDFDLRRENVAKITLTAAGATLPAETAARVVCLDANKTLKSSSVTTTELESLTGITAPVQTQFSTGPTLNKLSRLIDSAKAGGFVLPSSSATTVTRTTSHDAGLTHTYTFPSDGSTPAWVTPWGGIPTNLVNDGGKWACPSYYTSPATPSSGYFYASGLSFISDAGGSAVGNLEMCIYTNNEDVEGHPRIQIYRDGELVYTYNSEEYDIGTTAYFTAAFTSSAREVHTWHIIADGINVAMVSLSMPATCSAWADSRGLRSLWLGDSIGTGSTGDTYPDPALGFVHQMARMTKLEWDIQNLSIGGTGFVTAIGGYNHPDKWATYIAGNSYYDGIELVVLQGSVNDKTASESAVTSAVTGLLTTVRAALPNAVIFLTSAIGQPTDATVTTLNARYLAAFNSWTDASKASYYIDLSAIFNSTNYTTLTSDTTHPNAIGHNVLAILTLIDIKRSY